MNPLTKVKVFFFLSLFTQGQFSHRVLLLNIKHLNDFVRRFTDRAISFTQPD